jgi:hypothetical protein
VRAALVQRVEAPLQEHPGARRTGERAGVDQLGADGLADGHDLIELRLVHLTVPVEVRGPVEREVTHIVDGGRTAQIIRERALGDAVSGRPA